MRTIHRESWPLPPLGIIACAAAFTLLAILAGTIGTVPGDRWISQTVQRLHGEPWRMLWHLGNAFGTSLWIAFVAAIALIGILIWRYPGWRQDAWFLGTAMVLRIAAIPLKTIIGSPRPNAAQVSIIEPVSGYGFPSGHTLTATVLFGTVAVLLVRHWSGLHARITLLATLLWAGGVALTGFARIWGGAHWGSDVLGGALAGIVIIGMSAMMSCRAIPHPVLSKPQGPQHITRRDNGETSASRGTIASSVPHREGSGE